MTGLPPSPVNPTVRSTHVRAFEASQVSLNAVAVLPSLRVQICATTPMTIGRKGRDQ